MPDQVNLNGQWEVAFSETFLPSMYQNITEGKFMVYDDQLSKATEAYYFEPGLYSSISELFQAMNTLIQERNNHRDNCITNKVSRVTPKAKVFLANKESSLTTSSTVLDIYLEEM